MKKYHSHSGSVPKQSDFKMNDIPDKAIYQCTQCEQMNETDTDGKERAKIVYTSAKSTTKKTFLIYFLKTHFGSAKSTFHT